MSTKPLEGRSLLELFNTNDPKLSPFDLEILKEIKEIFAGADWILHAIILESINKGYITLDDVRLLSPAKFKVLNDHRFQEILPNLEFAEELRRVIISLPGTEKENFTEFILKYLLGSFPSLLLESIGAKEEMSQCNIIMVAGQQGAGKFAVTKYFESQGYEIVSMSQIVREMVQAWGLDPNQTVDKIVGGQIAKQYFGPDILVQLALHYLVSEGKMKVVIDGPRIPEEAQAVLKFGGRLIGVAASEKVRFERIKNRATTQTSREADVRNFEKREKTEGNNIDIILQMVKPEDLIINEDITEEELLTQLEQRYPEL